MFQTIWYVINTTFRVLKIRSFLANPFVRKSLEVLKITLDRVHFILSYLSSDATLNETDAFLGFLFNKLNAYKPHIPLELLNRRPAI